MKFEPDLLRDLLLYIEEEAKRPWVDFDDIKLAGWSDDDVIYHIVLAEEKGLIKATLDNVPDDEDPVILHTLYSVHRLTANGHDLLALMHEPKTWNLVKDRAKAFGRASVEILADVTKAYVRERIREMTGISLS